MHNLAIYRFNISQDRKDETKDFIYDKINSYFI